MNNPAVNYEDEEEYEIINGEVVMFAAPNINHIRVQRYLYNSIYNYLKGKRCEVFSGAKVLFEENHSYIPDLLVVCDKDKIKRTQIEGAPDFIAEILSLSTQSRDYGIKKDIYEKYGVKEYWIVDPAAKNIIVHVLDKGKYRVDNVYHAFSDEEWDELTPKQKAQQRLTLKISLYDDLEINIKDVFADEVWG